MKKNMINTLKLINNIRKEVKEYETNLEKFAFIKSINDENLNWMLDLDFNKYNLNFNESAVDVLKGLIKNKHNRKLIEDEKLIKYGDASFAIFLSKIPYENAISLGYKTLYDVYCSKSYNLNIKPITLNRVNETINYLKIKQLLLNINKDFKDVDYFYDELPIGRNIINIVSDNYNCIKDEKFYNILKYNFIYKVFLTDNRFYDLLSNYYKYDYFNDEYLEVIEKFYLDNPHILYDVTTNNLSLISLFYSLIDTFKIKELVDKIGLENLFELISKIQLNNNNISYFTNYEIKKLTTIDNINYEDPYETIYGEDSYVYKILKVLSETNDHFFARQIEDLVKRYHKKNVFLKCVYNCLDAIKNLSNSEFELFTNTIKKLDEVSNLNQFVDNLMKEILSSKQLLKYKYDFSTLNIKITPEEYILLNKLIYKIQDEEVIISLYNDMIGNKIKYNNRVLLLRQLSNQDIIKKDITNNYELFSKGYTLTDLYRKYGVDGKDWSFDEKYFYITNYNLLSYLNIDDLNIKLIINEFNNIEEDLNKKLPINKILENLYNSSIIYLKQFCNLTDDFIVKNKENIIKFCNKGLVEIVQSLENDYIFGNYKLQLKNLKLIVAAELSNQLKRIKYIKSDYKEELEIEVKEEVRKSWENCLTQTNDTYTTKECDSFEDLIRVGELPNKTCLFWKNNKRTTGAFYGMYNHTLLSNFDTNKKVIYVFDKNGKKVARSILRLTKTLEKTTSNNNKLGFLNVLEDNFEDNFEKEVVSTENDLVLFLERPYTSMTDFENVKQLMLNLAITKAKELNIRLLVSKDYENILNSCKKCDDLRIYISKSKNGEQYLDSLGGNNDADQGGTYYSAFGLYEATIN